MKFKDKIIFIISQDDWGTMFISKHHYALELAKMGNTVYYINGPDQRNSLKIGEVKISETTYSKLFLVQHRFSFPFFLKFHGGVFFDFLVKRHVSGMIRQIGKLPDIVWSFDLSNTIPLKCFTSKSLKIFMPVDEPLNVSAIRAANTADMIVSVTKEILEKYTAFPISKYFLNHGVASSFFGEDGRAPDGETRRVGLSGNFLRPDVDREILMRIIRENPTVVFELWGNTRSKDSNLSNESNNDNKTLDFIHFLETASNVICHGPVKTEELSRGLKRMNAFLICYDINKDQSRGTNYHKIMEYLAIGSVVISNNVSTYNDIPGLIEMTTDRVNNEQMPLLFKRVLNNLEEYNSQAKQMARKGFASNHLYAEQIRKIAGFTDCI